ncbi:hypothetical protein Sango_1042400 [Sesamum angolense]|uniref:F-box domain-containing protein n=1 Tax=Sesamum angolense TaxID=2727404 RepID=A0AAE1X1F4_9LAMI|nr:hypothetical protein Sango_1042400 [Sesamum angolense]
MGRATTSTILRRPSNSNITKRGEQSTSSNTIENIPRELLIEILSRIAQTSFTDIHNVKLSCKDFHEAAEDTYVYRHMSLDNFPLLDYFTGKRPKSALGHLQRALDANHIGALYVTCIILLFSGDDELKACGMKKSKYVRGKLKEDSDKLKSMLRLMWVENPALRRLPVCCTRQDNHRRRRSGWVEMDDEEEVHCEGCTVDSEIKFLVESLPQW